MSVKNSLNTCKYTWNKSPPKKKVETKNHRKYPIRSRSNPATKICHGLFLPFLMKLKGVEFAVGSQGTTEAGRDRARARASFADDTPRPGIQQRPQQGDVRVVHDLRTMRQALGDELRRWTQQGQPQATCFGLRILKGCKLANKTWGPKERDERSAGSWGWKHTGH